MDLLKKSCCWVCFCCFFFLNPEYGEDIVEAIIQANILPKWCRRCWSSAHSEVILSCRVGWGFCVCVCAFMQGYRVGIPGGNGF